MIEVTQNTYWTTPEDIEPDWAKMRQSLMELSNGHGGQFLTVYVLAKNGRLVEILEPDYCTIEPKRVTPSINSEGVNWWAFIRRMISAASNLNGRGGVVYASVILDSKENPVMWGSPQVRQMRG